MSLKMDLKATPGSIVFSSFDAKAAKLGIVDQASEATCPKVEPPLDPSKIPDPVAVQDGKATVPLDRFKKDTGYWLKSYDSGGAFIEMDSFARDPANGKIVGTVRSTQPGVYLTIADLLKAFNGNPNDAAGDSDDVKAEKKIVRRRISVLASVDKRTPATNWSQKDTNAGPKENEIAGADFWNQGKWKYVPFTFKPGSIADGGSGTSCTGENFGVMAAAFCKTDVTGPRWGFGIRDNPAFLQAGTAFPSVGDTYALYTGEDAAHAGQVGHCGVILEVPGADGIGLWLTADGGQGTTPNQTNVIVPRWGVLGKDLWDPPPSTYKDLKRHPEDKQTIWLAGDRGSGRGPALNASDSADSRSSQILAKLAPVGKGPNNAANPRRMVGFVQIGSDKIKMPVPDSGSIDQSVLAGCTNLGDVVNTVRTTFLGGTGGPDAAAAKKGSS